jgi:hypothetical protein
VKNCGTFPKLACGCCDRIDGIDGGEYGDKLKPGEASVSVSVADDHGLLVHLRTSRDFGCTLHEPRPDPSHDEDGYPFNNGDTAHYDHLPEPEDRDSAS